MAVRRKRTRVNRSRDIKLKQAAALHHNRKLVTLGGGQVKSSHEGRARRVENVRRRQQGRRKPTPLKDFARLIERGLDPSTWLVRAKGKPRGKRR